MEIRTQPFPTKQAEELCNQIRQKSTELQSKWRQSLQKKEEFLEEAGKWLISLRHLLSFSNDDEGIVSRIQSIGVKHSSRLHDSFTPGEEGHFVVTFPEWCQQSLNQLQEEMVDFTVERWHPRKLELKSECHLQDSNLGIFSLAGSDEDGHIFVIDWSDKSIKEFIQTEEFINQCHLDDKGFSLFDTCCLSKDILVVCGVLVSGPELERGGLLYLAPPFFRKSKNN